MLIAAFFGLDMAVVTLFGTRPYPQLGAAGQNSQEVLTDEAGSNVEDANDVPQD